MLTKSTLLPSNTDLIDSYRSSYLVSYSSYERVGRQIEPLGTFPSSTTDLRRQK